MQTRHPKGRILRRDNGPANRGTAIEPGQAGSYGTDRVRVANSESEADPATATDGTASPGSAKVDTGASPSVGSSPSRQR